MEMIIIKIKIISHVVRAETSIESIMIPSVVV